MIKERFFSDKLIKSYIVEFSEKLSSLPSNTRQQHIEEIKSDLYESALEKESIGISPEKIPQSVLKEFVSPKQLAIEISSEYGIEKNQNDLKVISYSAVLAIGSFGALAVPIVLGFINVSATLPFLLGFIMGNFWIIFRKIKWDEVLLGHFKKIIGISNWIIAIAFSLFAVRMVIAKQIDLFSLYYLVGYLLVSFLYLKFLRVIYKSKQA